MKKSELLSHLAVIMAATDHISDESDIYSVIIFGTATVPQIRIDEAPLPAGEIKKSWFIPGHVYSESVCAHGLTFCRHKNYVLPELPE